MVSADHEHHGQESQTETAGALLTLQGQVLPYVDQWIKRKQQ